MKIKCYDILCRDLQKGHKGHSCHFALEAFKDCGQYISILTDIYLQSTCRATTTKRTCPLEVLCGRRSHFFLKSSQNLLKRIANHFKKQKSLKKQKRIPL